MHTRPRGDLDRPERFGHPHVPDPGDEPLVLERLAEPTIGSAAQPRDGGVEVDLGSEHVLAEPADGPRLEREHRPVPEDALELVATKHEPRPPRPLLAARLDPPAPGHPQMAAHDDPPSNLSKRCLPTASTDSSTRPSIRSATPVAWPRGFGDSTSSRCPTSGCSRRAAR